MGPEAGFPDGITQPYQESANLAGSERQNPLHFRDRFALVGIRRCMGFPKTPEELLLISAQSGLTTARSFYAWAEIDFSFFKR